MLAYLLNLKIRLEHLRNGVVMHVAKWTGQAETPAVIETNIESIDTMQSEIEQMQNALEQKLLAARQLERDVTILADTIENKAIGFHTANPEVLNDYDIKLRKHKERKPIPSKALAVTITDDVDGVGFVLTTEVDPDAEHYEWQRGIGEVQLPNNMPPMQLYKNTTKLSFLDDDVETGVRYFYRVRAVNRSGYGHWSSFISRVQ